MPIRLALFDMAGTTVHDSANVADAVAAAMAAAGHPIEVEACRPLMGIPKPLAIRELLGNGAEDGLVDRIHADFVGRMVDFYRTDPGVKEIEGATEAFTLLRSKGVKVALDTGFSRPIADAIIERLDWTDKLDASVTSDEVANGRPHPDLVFEAMRRTGISDVEEVAKIGDTPSDTGEGLSAGCGLVIGVAYGTHSAEELRKDGVQIAESISQVTKLVLAV